MRPRAHGSAKLSLTDLAIAFGLVASFTYFVAIVEYHVGAGELTHAQLLLLGGRTRSAHSLQQQKRQQNSQEDSTHG